MSTNQHTTNVDQPTANTIPFRTILALRIISSSRVPHGREHPTRIQFSCRRCQKSRRVAFGGRTCAERVGSRLGGECLSPCARPPKHRSNSGMVPAAWTSKEAEPELAQALTSCGGRRGWVCLCTCDHPAGTPPRRTPSGSASSRPLSLYVLAGVLKHAQRYQAEGQSEHPSTTLTKLAPILLPCKRLLVILERQTELTKLCQLVLLVPVRMANCELARQQCGANVQIGYTHVYSSRGNLYGENQGHGQNYNKSYT